MPAVEYQYTQEEIDDALAMLIAHAGNINAARRELRAAGKKTPTISTLSKWSKVTHWERYEALRDKFAEKMEGKLSNDMLDAGRRATEGAILATEVAIERLKAGKDEDPARTAANLSRVAQSATDKRLSLQGRPSTITEARGPEEAIRKLIQMGVLQLPEEPVQIEGTVENGRRGDDLTVAPPSQGDAAPHA